MPCGLEAGFLSDEFYVLLTVSLPFHAFFLDAISFSVYLIYLKIFSLYLHAWPVTVNCNVLVNVEHSIALS
jgi:hypothetical protein